MLDVSTIENITTPNTDIIKIEKIIPMRTDPWSLKNIEFFSDILFAVFVPELLFAFLNLIKAQKEIAVISKTRGMAPFA